MLQHWREFFGLLVQQAPKQLNIADFKMQTPLMLMTEDGDTELARIMLQTGADPEMQDWQGMTALHSAIKSPADSCVDALRDHLIASSNGSSCFRRRSQTPKNYCHASQLSVSRRCFQNSDPLRVKSFELRVAQRITSG